MTQIDKKCGHYLGTEINKSWWRRYRSDGFLARGIGEFWLTDTALMFQRNHSQNPMIIPLQKVNDIRVGKWHSGRWAGGAPVVKIDWQKEDKTMSSGFVFSRQGWETVQLVQRLQAAALKMG